MSEGSKQAQPPPKQPQPTPKQGPSKKPPPPQKKEEGSDDFFTVSDLIDLALCSPEVGAVNFNILRMLLREIVVSTGIDKQPANVNDVEANQLNKFKNYVDGSPGTGTPMPGVLKIGPTQTSSGGGIPAGGYGGNGGGGLPNIATFTEDGQAQSSRGPRSRHGPRTPKAEEGGGADPDLFNKVAKLEKHLEALYQLPTNNEILDRVRNGGDAAMSVNDMWQIIQLNNRIAAAEAAIQKMASLIEDLAKNMGKVKHDNKNIRKDAEDLQLKRSDLQLQGQELSEKCEKFGDVVENIQKDVDNFKRVWKRDRDSIQKILGTDLGKIPSFMKPKQQEQVSEPELSPREKKKKPRPKKERGVDGGTGTPKGVAFDGDADVDNTGGDYAEDTAGPEQFERGTQTFVAAAKEADKGKPPTSGGEKSQRQPGQQPQSRWDQEQAGGQQRERQRQPPPPPRPKTKEEMIPPEKIAQMSGAEIAEKITPEEARQITAEAFKEMNQEQKKALFEVRKGAAGVKTEPPKPKMGVKNMTKEEIKELPPALIAEKMGYDEAVDLPPEVVESMDAEQREVLKKVIDKGPPAKKVTSRTKPKPPPQLKRKTALGMSKMKAEDIQEVAPAEIVDEMPYEEAQALSPRVLEKMTPAQKAAVKKVVDAGPEPTPPPEQTPEQRQQKSQAKRKPSMGVAAMNKEELEYVEPEEIEAAMSYEEAKSLPRDVLLNMTPEQQDAVKHVVEAGPEPEAPPSMPDGYVDDDNDDGAAPQPTGRKPKSVYIAKKRRSSEPLSEQEIHDIAHIPAKEMSKSISPELASLIPQQDLEEWFSPSQIKEIQQLREKRKTGAEGAAVGQESEAEETVAEEEDSPNQVDDEELQPTTDYDDNDDEDGKEGVGTDKSKRKSLKDRHKAQPARHRPEKSHHTTADKHHKHHHHHGADHDGDKRHTRVDVLKGAIPKTGAPLPPMTLEEYLASLPAEEAANLAADAVQRELQKQYQHLQGMQRQLATDIQDKMEYIYQKLLKEIATQQMTTSPYMSVDGPEDCLGPGVCTGHGMPAGIAVCQFPDAKGKKGTGPATDGKVCPGPGVCPGSAVCPYCRVDGKGHEDALRALKGPERKSVAGSVQGAATIPPGARPAMDMDGALLQEMKSLVMLDLDKIRDEMRSKQFGTYDEQDILERLSAIWEALKILKYNEEALAVKIARQDAFLKKIPVKTIEQLHKIPDETLDALATGDFHKTMYATDGNRKSAVREAEELFRGPRARSLPVAATGADKQDIQTLFNNLANVIAECAEQKERVDQINDTARILEAGMVTKQMLLDAMSDKADRGLINTKVSYDEFGNTIDELHTQLHNLMVEGYQRNENSKRVTHELSEELAEKLDKAELAPIRAFFKTHLRTLEDKVKNLTDLVEEPDSAGTRKKLLRDYNCLSCDRIVNISGVTNGPTLPTIGPVPAGHPTASKRALDLHRMRMLKRIDPNNKNLNALEKQRKGIRDRADKKAAAANPEDIAKDIDVMNVVNRYTGGSHTHVTHADLIAAQRRKTSIIPTEAPARLSNNVDLIEPAGAARATESKIAVGGNVDFMMMEE